MSYFFWRIKINYKLVLGCVSTHVMTHLLPHIHFKTDFCWQPSWFERKKEIINKLLITLICLKILHLEILTSRQNEMYSWKLTMKLKMYTVTCESVTVPTGRDRKIQTALRTLRQKTSVRSFKKTLGQFFLANQQS